MVPEHDSAGEWRSWQRTCFGSLEALCGVGCGSVNVARASEGVSIILRFANAVEQPSPIIRVIAGALTRLAEATVIAGIAGLGRLGVQPTRTPSTAR